MEKITIVAYTRTKINVESMSDEEKRQLMEELSKSMPKPTSRWKQLIAKSGALSINRAFPKDDQLLELLECAIRSLNSDYAGQFDFAPASPQALVDEFRTLLRAELPYVAKDATEAEKKHYVIKVLKNWISDRFFEEIRGLNPFSGGSGYANKGSAQEMAEYWMLAKNLRELTCKDFGSARSEALTPEEELECQQAEEYLISRYAVVGRLLKGLTLAEIRKELQELRGVPVTPSNVRNEILQEACEIARAAGKNVEEVYERAVPLVNKLRGTRGPYKKKGQPETYAYH